MDENKDDIIWEEENGAGYPLDEKSVYSNNNLDIPFLQNISPLTLVITKLVVLLATILIICPALILGFNDRKILKFDYYATMDAIVNAKKDIKANIASDMQVLKINPVSSYNYLTRAQIYDIRKKYVQKSLFATKDYEPNAQVFGGISDGKPWWNTKPCTPLGYSGDYHERIQGNSKVSAQVNNPNALVGVSATYSLWERPDNKDFCESKGAMFDPELLVYKKSNNMMIALYDVPDNFPSITAKVDGKNIGFPLQLSGLNALDFGYKYVFAIELKNAALMYPENSNMLSEVQQFRDYLHVGGSCKYKGGCNNISPLQNALMFHVKYLPAIVTVKLWKDKPMNKFSKPDMYYRIIID